MMDDDIKDDGARGAAALANKNAKKALSQNASQQTVVAALQTQVQQHDAQINALQQQTPGGAEGATKFQIHSANVADLSLTGVGSPINLTLTTVDQEIVSALSSAIITNNSGIPSGAWSTNIDFTSNQQKEFDSELKVFRVVGAVETLLCTLTGVIPAGANTIALSGEFAQFAFDSGDKLKFVLSLKSNHVQTITITPNMVGQNKDCHIHTPVLISNSYTRAQADALINLKQTKHLVVATQTDMLALTESSPGVPIQPGQVVIRSDDNYYNYLLTALPASSLVNWQPMGKDAPSPGETVADVITTNENLAAKANGAYAIAGIPSGGLPVGVSLGDIVQKTGSSYSILYTFAAAPAVIFANSDSKTYNKSVTSGGDNTWDKALEPSYYEAGAGRKYSTAQAAIDQARLDFLAGKISISVIDVFDTINSSIIIAADMQNTIVRGIGTKYRGNVQFLKIEIYGHRITLDGIQCTNVAQTPLIVNSTGTVTESGVPNTAKGKHIFINCVFSTNVGSNIAADIQGCDNFLIFDNCDVGGKIINIANKTGTATSVTIENCNNGVLNLGNNRIATKNNSPSVYKGSISNTGTVLLDVDAAKPIAYSILRSYSALGVALPMPVGALVINDDVGGNLANLKCTTAYTIAAALGVGTPIDLTKYQVQTDSAKQNTIPDGNNINKIATDIASASTVNLNNATGDYVKITGTNAITAFTLTAGVKKYIEFGAALNLTHNATSLILPTEANITTSAGDTCIIVGIAGGVKVHSYQKFNGAALAGGGGFTPPTNEFNANYLNRQLFIDGLGNLGKGKLSYAGSVIFDGNAITITHADNVSAIARPSNGVFNLTLTNPISATGTTRLIVIGSALSSTSVPCSVSQNVASTTTTNVNVRIQDRGVGQNAPRVELIFYYVN